MNMMQQQSPDSISAEAPPVLVFTHREVKKRVKVTFGPNKNWTGLTTP